MAVRPVFGNAQIAPPVNVGSPFEPPIAAPPRPQPPPTGIPPVVDQSRTRLAEAILKATGGGEPQIVNHPMQALGNAAQQIAAANLQRQQRPPAPTIPGASGPAGPSSAAARGSAAAVMRKPPGQMVRPNMMGRRAPTTFKPVLRPRGY